MRSSTLVSVASVLLVSLLALGAGACDDDGGLLVVQDGGGLTVTSDPATGATTPTYAWDGAPARELTVTRADGTGVVWRLEALDIQQGFASPVQQGIVPEGARETTAADLLRADVDYRVRVEDVEGAFGSVVFRPSGAT